MPHGGERTEGDPSPAFPRCRRHKLNSKDSNSTQWLVPLQAALAPPPHPSIASLSLGSTQNMCRYVQYSHSRGHTQQTARGWLKRTVTCKEAANPEALLTSRCSTSYTEPGEREKSKLKSFVPAPSMRLSSSCTMWCRKKSA